MNNKENKWITKIKNIKHLDVAIVIIFVGVLLLLYFSDGTSFINNGTATTTETQAYYSYKTYTEYLESKLIDVLSQINGVGKINIMITLESSPELVIAYDTETYGVGETLTTKKEPIIITQNGISSPLILSELLPKIRGVVIVAQGADNVAVKLDLLTATIKLLDISVDSIEIFAGS